MQQEGDDVWWEGLSRLERHWRDDDARLSCGRGGVGVRIVEAIVAWAGVHLHGRRTRGDQRDRLYEVGERRYAAVAWSFRRGWSSSGPTVFGAAENLGLGAGLFHADCGL